MASLGFFLLEKTCPLPHFGFNWVCFSIPSRKPSRGSASEKKQLTSLNQDLLGHKDLATTEELRFKSAHDGRSIHGWIVKPPGFDAGKKYPLILEIHGGPFANYGPRFAANMQLFAAPGYVVLYGRVDAEGVGGM